MGKLIKVKCDFSKVLNFAMQQNRVPVIRSLQIANISEKRLEKITVEIFAKPEFSAPAKYTFENLDPQELVDITSPDNRQTFSEVVDLHLDPNFFMGITERFAGLLEIVVSVNSVEVERLTQEISLLAYNEWGGDYVLPELLAAYITPNHPLVAQVLRRASEKLKSWTGDGALCGYQRKSENHVLKQMAAIFAALEELDIHYSMPPQGFEISGQKIRTCDEIATQKLGTCLDLSILYASCLEQAWLHPIIVLTKDHAFAGCWLVEETFASAVQDDLSLLSKRVSNDVGEICLVECTLFAQGTQIDFDKAVNEAKNHLLKENYFQFFIDVKQARFGNSIRPIPQRKYDAEGNLEKLPENQEEKLDETTWSAPEEIEIAEKDESEGPVKHSKQRIWQNKLLNMTLRNSLLNFKPTGKSIQLICNDLGILEDALTAKEEFKIVEFFDGRKKEFENNFISIAKDDDIDELLDHEFQNKRLRTFMGKTETENKIRALYRAARASLEENGSNTLYLALGFLKWYETKVSEKALYAPLVLLPLEIVHKSAGQNFIIRERDEEPQFNITLLEKLRGEFNLVINGLDPLPIDGSGLDIKKIFATVRQAIKNKKRWDVVDYAFIGQFSFSQYIMWNDIRQRSEELSKNKIVKGLIDGVLPETLPELVASETLDASFKPSDMAIPLSADSSQMAAICSAAKGCSFVLHGPPGTGKSQTITNMIANALFNGKSVLFIAEKMAALSVVQNRLEKQGLGAFCLELHSNKANKSSVMKQLNSALEFGKRQAPSEYKSEAENLHKMRVHLNSLMDKIHKVRASGYSLYDVIGFFEEHPEFVGAIPVKSNLVKSADSAKLKEWFDASDRFKIMGELCGNVSSHPLSDWNCCQYSETERENISNFLDQLEHSVIHISEILSELKQKFTTLNIDSQDKAEALSSLCDNLGTIDALPLGVLFKGNSDFENALADACKNGRLRNEIQDKIDNIFEPEIYDIDAVALRGEWKDASAKWFIPKFFGQRKTISALRRLAKNPKIDKDHVAEILDKLVEFKRHSKSIDESAAVLSNAYGNFWKSYKSDWNLLEQQYALGTKQYGIISRLYNDPNDISAACKDIADLGTFRERNNKILADFKRTYEETQNFWRFIRTLTNMEREIPFGDNWTSGLLEKIRSWKANLHGLRDWCNYNACKKTLADLGIKCVSRAIESGRVAISDVTTAFRTNVAYRLIILYIEEDSELGNINASLIEHEIKHYKQSIEKFAELTRKELIAKLSANIPSSTMVASSSEIGILKRSIASKCKGKSIRQLFDSIPTLLRKLTPCMLMSPISVAQYIGPTFPKFDLVIFDEASQLPTCEAVGAIARGENLIVVGDPKQMPPTSFFKKGYTDEDNLDKEDLESILDDCLAISMPEMHLLWHYRSKDESLIAFSNYKYYDHKLFTFPSPSDIEGCVKFIPVKGTYDRSKTRQNLAEAKLIVEEIIRRLKDKSERKKSIGVVTFSVVQQNLIDDLLDDEFSKNPKLEEWSKTSGEEIFIKNLESVQGDERDVIIFSIGYGPDHNGNVSLNFGPINNAGGWRRLNVAVSRSRYEMLVYSTLQPEQIDLNRSSSEGVAGLKAFLTYAKYGKRALPVSHVAGATSAKDSFKISIANELKKLGYNVELDVGCSKFKMDLAIVHPENEKKFILGILCDGKNYKKARTAKDRNVLQQSILETLGWNIVRLWSFEWFLNREHRDSIVQGIKQKIDQIIEKEKQPVLIDDVETSPVEETVLPAENASGDMGTNVSDETTGLKTFQSMFKTYQLANVEHPPKGRDIYDMSSTELLKSQIEKIVRAESPISSAVLDARLSDLWNAKRTQKFINRIHGFCKYLHFAEKQENGKTFYWNPDSKGLVEFRRPSDGFKRNVDDIPMQEIAFAVKAIVDSQISIELEEMERLIAKVSGFTKCTSQMKDVIDRAIEWAAMMKFIAKDGNRIAMIKQ